MQNKVDTTCRTSCHLLRRPATLGCRVRPSGAYCAGVASVCFRMLGYGEYAWVYQSPLFRYPYPYPKVPTEPGRSVHAAGRQRVPSKITVFCSFYSPFNRLHRRNKRCLRPLFQQVRSFSDDSSEIRALNSLYFIQSGCFYRNKSFHKLLFPHHCHTACRLPPFGSVPYRSVRSSCLCAILEETSCSLT